ncbi:ABC transporter ATP-binding protein [Rhizobium sp. AU243]|uniref:ABC transporter ATP-binding protein n=1 Tax=Rhizobium sp. AU243 TaxID=2303425 RepID=UPI0010CB3CC3|nr:ABC transporter ATP-binding protein [Rhizobium sp. AU243]TKV70564.1 ABC transporter ATP-binding protein [Rhizobium sp. AU243]
MTEALLEISNLRTEFQTKAGILPAVNDVSFTIGKGRVLGLVGESGSGKSVTGFSIIGLIDKPGRIAGGSIRFKGEELVGKTERRMRSLRGDRISMIFQDPMMTLNPVLKIGTQMIECMLAHRQISKQDARERAREMLALVGISSPDERLDSYPHQFSGGMRQRVAIATALLLEPDLVIADEPTTALDVTIQAQILALVQKLVAARGTSLLWITHDLSVISGLADDLAVMYGGRIVEQGPVGDVLSTPRHPYTVGLLGSIPSRNEPGRKLRQIPGSPPNVLNLPQGCPFQQRCDRRRDDCQTMPPPAAIDPLHMVRCHHPFGGPAHA